MARAHELLSSLTNAQAGGILAQPPGLDGDPGLGIAGVSGSPRGKTWDAVVSAHAPELTGDSVTFAALENGTLVVDQDVPDGSLEPVAEAIEAMLPVPYRAAAARAGSDVWTAVAEAVRIVRIPDVEADEVDLAFVDGERTATAGGDAFAGDLPALERIAREHDSVALHAERIDGDLYAVDVFPL